MNASGGRGVKGWGWRPERCRRETGPFASQKPGSRCSPGYRLKTGELFCKLASGTLPTGNRTFCFAKARFALLTGLPSENRRTFLQAGVRNVADGKPDLLLRKSPVRVAHRVTV